jgi:hypothetical protein
MKIEVNQYEPDVSLTLLVTTDLAEGRYAVRVNGVEHKQFDSLKGDVDISGKSGVLTIEAFFGPMTNSPRANQPARNP